MAYLGANEAAFRLGNQAVSVYLGAVEVYSPSATLYFNAAVDNDWATLGNWWLDDEHTVAATALPTAADSVIATAFIDSNSGSEPTVVNFTMEDESGNYANYYAILLTVTGIATFNGTSFIDVNQTLNGNATFNDLSGNGGTVTGNATFNDSSSNDGGTVTGNATFNDSSFNGGTVTGTITDNR